MRVTQQHAPLHDAGSSRASSEAMRERAIGMRASQSVPAHLTRPYRWLRVALLWLQHIDNRMARKWRLPFSPLKVGVLAFTLLAAAALLRALPWSLAPGNAARLYYQAAVDLRHGHTPYSAAIAWAATHPPTDWRNIYMDVYTYPPLLALVLVPFTVLPPTVVAVLWSLLSIACAGYLAAYLARLVLPSARGLDRILAVGIVLDLVLLFGPLRHSMRGGQADIELVALVIASWNALHARRTTISGLLLGLAIVVKPTYLLLLGFHLWRREWRAGAAALLTAALGLGVPFLLLPHQVLADFLHVSAFWNAPGFVMAPKSISVFGVLERAFYTVPGIWSTLSAPLVARVLEVLLVLAVYIGGTALVEVNQSRGVAHWNYTFGLAVLVMLLGSPLTEDAHLSLALIPLAVCIAVSIAHLRSGDRAAWLWLLAATLFFVYVTLPVRTAASFSTYTGWHVLWAGYWFYGLALLSALYVWIGRKTLYSFSGASVLASAVAYAARLTRVYPHTT